MPVPLPGRAEERRFVRQSVWQCRLTFGCGAAKIRHVSSSGGRRSERPSRVKHQDAAGIIGRSLEGSTSPKTAGSEGALMSIAPTDEEKLKSLFKAALIEVLDERWDLVREALEEVIEDIALTRAIDEAAGGADVSREEV